MIVSMQNCIVHFVGELIMQDVMSEVQNIDNNGQTWY